MFAVSSKSVPNVTSTCPAADIAPYFLISSINRRIDLSVHRAASIARGSSVSYSSLMGSPASISATVTDPGFRTASGTAVFGPVSAAAIPCPRGRRDLRFDLNMLRIDLRTDLFCEGARAPRAAGPTGPAAWAGAASCPRAPADGARVRELCRCTSGRTARGSTVSRCFSSARPLTKVVAFLRWYRDFSRRFIPDISAAMRALAASASR
mmetsp:Transcript_13256/g.33868  ORF Transcript_13256/g.33868 Transcript_13256/m.33868 type:complete len:209 (-) Transcript_13256:246-872(-)